METRNVKVSLETAKRWYQQGGEFKEMALSAYSEAELNPVKNEWESRFVGKRIEGYFVEPIDNNVYGYEENFRASLYCKHIFKTEKQAKSALAYAQLTQLMVLEEYNGDWVADWDDDTSKYAIVRRCNEVVKDTFYNYYCPIVFKSNKIQDKFMDNNYDLLRQYFELD